MPVELVNKNQFSRRAGLNPRPPYSRVIMLQMATVSGNNKTAEVQSAVLGSSGVLLSVHIHVHQSVVQQASFGALWLGYNRQNKIGGDGGVSFRESIIRSYGTDPDSINLMGIDQDYDLDMEQRFTGDNTRIAMAMRTFNQFTTMVQAFYQIAEG